MPYLGDSPSNPVPLTLSGGAAVGEATSPTEHDRHVCWFSVPAQAAGNSIRLDTLVGASPGGSGFWIVMVWDGGNTAHYVAFDELGVRQSPAYRPLPAGVDVLIGVFPPGHSSMVGARFNDRGIDQGLSALTDVQWDTEFPSDLTKRLPAGVELSVVVEATADPSGTPTNPLVMDFTVSQDAQTLDLDAWEHPTFAIEPVLPAGYGLEVSSSENIAPGVELTGALNTFSVGTKVIIKPDPLVSSPTLSPAAAGALPAGTLSVRAVQIADLSGLAIDTDGASAEPCNVLLFRTLDAFRASQAPSGTFTMLEVPEGDYIAVFFSQADGRDVRATNVLVPPGTRPAGGGYPFLAPPGP